MLSALVKGENNLLEVKAGLVDKTATSECSNCYIKMKMNGDSQFTSIT